MRKFLSLAVILAVASVSAFAQVTLGECRELAMQNHPSIRQYGLIDATRDFTVSNASMQWLPSIRVGALAGVGNNVPTIDDVFGNSTNPTIKLLKSELNWKDPSKYIYKAEAELSQSVYDGGASRTAKKVAQAQADYQKAETDVMQDQVRSKVDEVYFSVLLLEKRILGVNSKIEVLNAVQNGTSYNYKVGNVRQTDLDAITAAKLDAEQQLITLQSTVESFRAVLSILTGKDMSSCELVVPSVLEQPMIDPMGIMFDKKLALLSLEKQRLDVSCRPRLDLVADAYYGYPNRNILQDLRSNDPKFNVFVGVRLSWNLSSLYTRKNNLGLISNSLAQVNIKNDIFERDIQLQNASVNSELLRLRKCIEKDNELVELRSRLRKSAEFSYNQGTINANELISAVDAEFQACLNAQIHEIESLRESYRERGL